MTQRYSDDRSDEESDAIVGLTYAMYEASPVIHAAYFLDLQLVGYRHSITIGCRPSTVIRQYVEQASRTLAREAQAYRLRSNWQE